MDYVSGHTVTEMEENGALVVGGRTSPDNALADCWIWHKWVGIWEHIDPLPQARYRHSAVYLGQGCVLVSPGKNNSRDIGGDFYVWSRQFGWKVCISRNGDRPPLTQGSTLTIFSDTPTSPVAKRGLLAGGISNSGILEQEIWKWEVESYASPVRHETLVLFMS